MLKQKSHWTAFQCAPAANEPSAASLSIHGTLSQSTQMENWDALTFPCPLPQFAMPAS